MQQPHFSQPAITFLRGLKRHNDRAWFEERKPLYESALKTPLLAVIEAINQALSQFAPDYVRPPHKCMMRIYRDVRFSPNKNPYKTNIAAWWARVGLEKTSGAGFYLQLDPEGLTIAGGAYMPERDQLLAIRRFLLEHHEEYREIVGSKKLRDAMQPLDPLKMARGPKGFPAGHPAMDLILQRQWGVSAHLPVEMALEAGLVNAVVASLRLAMPLVEFLNRPLGKPAAKPFL